MKDRFKFRLWDKAIGQMSYDVCVGFIKDGARRDWVCADTTCGQITYIDKRLNDIVLMQCTGLKDKNGQLIYEGDIVEVWKLAGNIFKRMIVKWHESQCSFRLYDLAAMGATPQKMVDKRAIGAVTSIKVIGNNFENEELLK